LRIPHYRFTRQTKLVRAEKRSKELEEENAVLFQRLNRRISDEADKMNEVNDLLRHVQLLKNAKDLQFPLNPRTPFPAYGC